MNLVGLLTLFTQIALFFVILRVVFKMGPIALGLRMSDHIVRNISGAPIQRLSRITPHLYVGGQHSQRGWPKMQQMGVTALVNMRERQFDDKANGIAPERYLHLPTDDGTPPTFEDLRSGIAFITDEIGQGGVVYIHCASGIGRAPTMAIAYLMATGLSHQEAVAKIKKVRPFIRPRPSQTAQLTLFEEGIRKNRGPNDG
jgi:hypothetical protein